MTRRYPVVSAQLDTYYQKTTVLERLERDGLSLVVVFCQAAMRSSASTSLDYKCPHCGWVHRVSASLRGKKVRCAACQEVGRVSAGEKQVVPPPVQSSVAHSGGTSLRTRAAGFLAAVQTFPWSRETLGAALAGALLVLVALGVTAAFGWALRKPVSTAAASPAPDRPWERDRPATIE